MSNWQNNSNHLQRLKLTIGAAGIILLAGCVAGSPGPAIVGLDALAKPYLQPPSDELFHARIISPHSPYVVDYDVTIHGKQKKTSVQPQLVAQGQYQNWNWEINAGTQVADVLQSWLNVVQPPAEATDVSKVNPALDWDSMMKRLYQLDTYLLGSPPLPLHIQVMVLPKEEFNYKATLSSEQALPLMVIVSDQDLNPNSTRFELSQTAVVFSIQSVIQGLLANAEWKAGILPKPSTGSSVRLKYYANQVCWGKSANFATVAGLSHLPSSIAETLQHTISTFGVSVVKTNYYLSPDDHFAAYSMSQTLVDSGIKGYLKQQDLNNIYANREISLKHINAIIAYCRAFTHYSGDIESEPLQANAVKIGEFFPNKAVTPTSMAKPIQ